MNLNLVEIKAFVPAKDYEQSIRFYHALGFDVLADMGNAASLRCQSCAFMLQNFYLEEHAINTTLHLLVEDAQAWFDKVSGLNLEHEFSAKVTDLSEQRWGMLEFFVVDPSGVLIRIGQQL
ncbi:VOC family protein [Thaumasiovibrio subtropicus]|uniref:VOC family protein n=1 Tax=Thaumasiovibrio subtropicus TaxID=1891207 RepID=UPI000B35E841|nr:VOC family protein [Thaumasiovibrio subtropicus]